MKRLRDILSKRVLADHLLLILIFLGTFQFEGVLAEAPISQIEVAYVELVAQERSHDRLESIEEINERVLPQKTFQPSLFLRPQEVLRDLLSKKSSLLYKQQDIFLESKTHESSYSRDIRNYPPSEPIDSV